MKQCCVWDGLTVWGRCCRSRTVSCATVIPAWRSPWPVPSPSWETSMSTKCLLRAIRTPESCTTSDCPNDHFTVHHLTLCYQGDHLSGKPGNVREFETCPGNVRDNVNSQGNNNNNNNKLLRLQCHYRITAGPIYNVTRSSVVWEWNVKQKGLKVLNISDNVNSQGNVREKILSGKSVPKLFISRWIFAFIWVFSSIQLVLRVLVFDA